MTVDIGESTGSRMLQPTVAAPLSGAFARKGEHVTCDQGHRIATVARDIVGDRVVAEDLTDWCFGETLPDGVPPPPCQCGAIWWRPVLNMCGQWHFSGGWR